MGIGALDTNSSARVTLLELPSTLFGLGVGASADGWIAGGDASVTDKRCMGVRVNAHCRMHTSF